MIMETFNLCFRGKIIAHQVPNYGYLPKSAKLFDCDNLETSEGLIGDSVNIYTTSTKKGIKYFICISKTNKNTDYPIDIYNDF